MAEATNPIPTASNPRVGEDEVERLAEIMWRAASRSGESIVVSQRALCVMARAALASAPSPEAGAGGDREALRKSLTDITDAADKMILSLPGHWHDDATIELTDAASDARAVLSDATQDDLYKIAAADVTSGTHGNDGELERLSATAAQGKWGVVNGVISVLPSSLGSGIANECGTLGRWAENCAFIVALVNAFRDGKLVASTGAEEETKGASASQTGLLPNGPTASRSSGFAAAIPSRGPVYRGQGIHGERFALGQILMEAFGEHGAGFDIGRGVFELGVDRVLMAREALAGEARSAETHSGSVEDEHAARRATPEATPKSFPDQTPVDPPMTVEEARAFLDGLSSSYMASEHYARWLRLRANGVPFPTKERDADWKLSNDIEAALRILQAGGEVR